MKDIHDLVSDLQTKVNFSIDKISGFGAIEAAMQASKIAGLAIPRNEGIAQIANRYKELDFLGGGFIKMNSYQNMAADIAAKQLGIPSIATAAGLAAQKHELFKVSDSLKTIMGHQGSIAELMNSASKSIFNVPPDYGNSLAKIIENQNSIFSRISEQKSVLSSFGAMQADILAKYSWMNTDSFLASTIAAKNWDDLQTFEEETSEINSIAEEVLSGSAVDPIAFNALQNKFDQLATEFALEKNKGRRNQLWATLSNIMNVICWALAVWAAYQQFSDPTNAESTETITKAIDVSNKTILDAVASSEKRMLDSIRKISNTRVAIANLNVRFSPRKKSQKVGMIKMGQEVQVLSIDHKWLYVMYNDSESGKPTTGWVLKKWCEKK